MIKEIKTFVQENLDYRHNLLKLAVSSAKSDTKKTTLGMYWIVVKDIIFFVTYGFFMTMIRAGTGSVNGIPLLVYLFTGLVAWYCISDILNQGVKCIVKNKGVFTKIKFPILAIPTYETIAIFIKRIPTFVLLLVILVLFSFFTPFMINVNIFGLIYSIFAIFIFGLSFILLFSGFFAISKDFRELYKAIVRVQFYFVPIFWSISEVMANMKWIPHWVEVLVTNLPFIHIIESFRYSLTSGEFPPVMNIIIFLIICFILFALGCYVQYRLRRIYSDFI